MTKRILIVGAGGHAQVIVNSLLHSARDQAPAGFVDNNPELIGQSRIGLPIWGSLADIAKVDHDALIIGIGNNKIRQQLFHQMQDENRTLATVIDPQAIVAPGVRIGPGTLIAAGAIVSVGVKIGANVIVNTGAIIDHHSAIGNHVHVAQGAQIGGDVNIGAGALIGMGATVVSQSKIPEWESVAPGSVVESTVHK